MNSLSKFFWRRISFLFTFSALCMLIVSVTYFAGERITSAGTDAGKDTAATPKDEITVIIDAGHGGRDGGASTEDGVLEKHLNLAVAKKVQALLSCADVNVVMTRESDIMLADEDSSHKKRDDLNARLHMADAYENCIFVSIHMNKFPVAKYSGLQVYYSKNHAGSALLADTIQEKTAAFLQTGNSRITKAADDSIYILHNIKVPAVLVECGFLSNPEEAALLQTESYQNKLAAVICASVLEYLESAE
ncbi:MAG: N-acetylmuramoyl-L-alanine amidase [Clostridia bacterium]|nr:N-acetylmuramoyl-L-alanine amidase [Clostridia bacterium]